MLFQMMNGTRSGLSPARTDNTLSRDVVIASVLSIRHFDRPSVRGLAAEITVKYHVTAVRRPHRIGVQPLALDRLARLIGQTPTTVDPAKQADRVRRRILHVEPIDAAGAAIMDDDLAVGRGVLMPLPAREDEAGEMRHTAGVHVQTRHMGAPLIVRVADKCDHGAVGRVPVEVPRMGARIVDEPAPQAGAVAAHGIETCVLVVGPEEDFGIPRTGQQMRLFAVGDEDFTLHPAILVVVAKQPPLEGGFILERSVLRQVRCVQMPTAYGSREDQVLPVGSELLVHGKEPLLADCGIEREELLAPAGLHVQFEHLTMEREHDHRLRRMNRGPQPGEALALLGQLLAVHPLSILRHARRRREIRELALAAVGIHAPVVYRPVRCLAQEQEVPAASSPRRLREVERDGGQVATGELMDGGAGFRIGKGAHGCGKRAACSKRSRRGGFHHSCPPWCVHSAMRSLVSAPS